MPGGKLKRRVVEAAGWQLCAVGLGQSTQACLYKKHHFLIFPVWKRNRCGARKYDRRPTFRSVATRKLCMGGGEGTWRTVIFGSIFYDGPLGLRRYYGAVRSDDKEYSRCN